MIKLSQIPIKEVARRAGFRRNQRAGSEVMRIAVLGTRGFPHVQGGIEAHCEHLYSLLAEQGYHVTVFAREQYVGISQPYVYKGVHIVPLPCVKNKFLEAFLHTLIGIVVAKQYKPDILHIHAIGPSFFAPVGRLLGMKVVVTNHGPDYERKKWGKAAQSFLRLSELIGFIFSSRVIAIAPGIKNKHPRFAGKTSYVPNGVVARDIIRDESVIKKFGLVSGKYILSVGRLVPEKGFIDLIDAFERFQSENPVCAAGFKLVIVGKADHETAYSLMIEERARANRNIVLTGFLTGRALQEIYSHAGLFVLASYHEGLSLALLEALGYGLSCVASNIESNHLVELDSKRYYSVCSIALLAAAMKACVEGPLTDSQKDAQIRYIRELYDWKIIVKQTQTVYLSLIKRSTERPAQ
jgi:glycosyltransferase involved in cell wall biosynthesis